jgi:hypothetical protein
MAKRSVELRLGDMIEAAERVGAVMARARHPIFQGVRAPTCLMPTWHRNFHLSKIRGRNCAPLAQSTVDSWRQEKKRLKAIRRIDPSGVQSLSAGASNTEIIGGMLKEGIDVYVPLVDDHAVDAIIKRRDGSAALIQIKARSKDVIFGDAALFAAIPHKEVRQHYWFIFYSERMDMIWIMSSEEFDREAVKNKSGRNVGLRSIWFNGKRKNKSTDATGEYCKPQWEKYFATSFGRIAEGLARELA